MTMPIRPALFLVILALSVSLGHGCDVDCHDDSPGLQTETAQQAIVGGKEEPGWEGVGALTRVATAYGYYGSFCSGTLVAQQWVLTAAHCLSGEPSNPLYPENVKFFVGPNSNPKWYGVEPDDGRLFQADAFFIHPQYNAKYTSNDIALMHLARPVEDVPIYPMNEQSMTNSLLSKEVLYVGYGVANGISNQGGGIKRSGYMTLWAVESTSYVSGFKKSGVCFGDSGGPGLLEFGGEMRVIGVNSTVFSQSGDPCTGGAVQTRVDVYADWIAETMGSEAVDCRVNQDLCFCPQACTADGFCDNRVCKTKSCGDVRLCFDDCNGSSQCQADCFVRTSAEGLEKLYDYYWCRLQKCYNSGDPEGCADSQCAEYKTACKERLTGFGSCQDVYSCVAACDWDDPLCYSDCYNTGTEASQGSYDALWGCFESECATLPDYGFQQSCGWDQCAFETEVCVEPADCSILGGGCPTGTACWSSPTNKTDCFPSDGLGEGDLCPLLALDSRPCVDGLQCVAVGGNTECRQICADESECSVGEACVVAEIPGLPAYGYCACVDEDEDGFCSLADCDDSNPDVYPGQGEKCWDEIDNNCDGEVDEGCATDADDPDVNGTVDLGAESSGCATAPVSCSGAWMLLMSLIFLLAFFRRIGA
jgi:hypothetical protein